MEEIYEQFDALWRKLHLQARRLEELETRCTELERRLRDNEPTDFTRPVLRVIETQEVTA